MARRRVGPMSEASSVSMINQELAQQLIDQAKAEG
jgi:hypothetical protein